jgi:hypothetical protein
VSTYDDDPEPGFFDETETLEAPRRPPRRVRRAGSGGPGRPAPPPPGAVALTRLAGLVGIAIAVVVGLVFWVGSCQGTTRHEEYAAYMGQIRGIATNSAKAGKAFANELSAKLTLAGLQAKLEQWSKQQQQEYDDALRLRPPGPLQAAHQEVLATLQLRAIGLAGLADAIARAGSDSAAAVGASLAGQAQFLSASDIVWSELFRLPATETLKSLGIRGVSAPPSSFVSNPDAISAKAFGLVYRRLKSTTSSGTASGLHGSALESTQAVAGSKIQTLSTSAPTTVPVANLAFKVTFLNSGNFQEVRVPVTLTVKAGGKVVLSQRHVVASILPQQRITVTFGNLGSLQNSAYGGSATVHVDIATVPGEASPDNNSASYPVFFSLTNGG